MSLMDVVEAHAAAITTAGTPAYTDERKALANRPCLLFAPPVLDYANGGTMTGPQVTFRVLALSTMNAPAFDALNELQDLIEAADEALTIERAEPIQYPTRAADGKPSRPIAAYLITTTEYPL